MTTIEDQIESELWKIDSVIQICYIDGYVYAAVYSFSPSINDDKLILDRLMIQYQNILKLFFVDEWHKFRLQ